MTPRFVRWGLWLLATLATLAAVGAWALSVNWTMPSSSIRLAVPPPVSLEDAPGAARGDVRTLRETNPFRLARKPTGVRANPWAVAPAAQSAAPAPRAPQPLLSISGVLGGPPWVAIVEGIPGRETGILLGIGEEASGIRVMAVRGDTVHLANADTTWTLAPRRP